MFGFVAVFRNRQDGLMFSVRGRFNSAFKEDHIARYEACRKDPTLRPVKFYLVSDEKVYFKLVLQVKLNELREYVKYHKDYINGMMSEGFPRNVTLKTDKMMADMEKTLMRSVALRTKMCFNHDVEVTDELALMCYDWKYEKAV